MKLWLRMIAMLLILVVSLTAIGCGEPELDDDDDDDDKNNTEESTTGGNNGGTDGGGSLPADPSLPVDHTASFPSGRDTNGNSFSYLVRNEYAEDGRLLREYYMSEEFYFLPTQCVEHTYEGNSLIRSTLYQIENQHDIYSFHYKASTYTTYTYNVKGQAVQGTEYLSENEKPTGATVTMEYHDNGTLKKTSYLKNGEAYFVTENDENGRRIRESFEGSQLTLQYEGESRKAQSAILKDSERQSTSWNLAYNAGGNITRLSDMGSSDRFVALTYTSTKADAKPTKCEISYRKEETTFSYNAKGFLSQVDCVGADYTSTFKPEFNAQDLLSKLTMTEGDGSTSTEEFSYNQDKKLTKYSHTAYDKNRNLELEDHYSYVYNTNGSLKTQLLTETRKDEKTGSLFTCTYKTEYTYDTSGVPVREVYTATGADGSRQEETRYFDAEGELLRTVTKIYDASGNLLHEETQNGSELTPNPGGTVPNPGLPSQTLPIQPPFGDKTEAPKPSETNADTEAGNDGNDGSNNNENVPPDAGNDDSNPGAGDDVGGNDNSGALPLPPDAMQTLPPIHTTPPITVNPDYTKPPVANGGETMTGLPQGPGNAVTWPVTDLPDEDEGVWIPTP